MTEEKDKVEQQKPETPESKPKSNLMKYIMYGVAGLVLIGGIAFGVGFMLKDSPKADNSQTEEATDKVESTKQDKHPKQAKKDAHDDSEIAVTSHDDEMSDDEFIPDTVDLEGIDRSAIEKIVDNLEFLDYQPDESELETGSGMSVEDSINEMNWIEKEKTDLAKREAKLKTKEKELQGLAKTVDAKIMRIEQAESNRVSQLAKLYDGMDSRAVAKLMMSLDDETVVSILPRMKNKQASLVLQMLPSKRAALLSKQMITIAEK